MGGSSVETPELRLVERAAAGDRGAQALLFARHRAAAYRVAFRITGRQQDALDAVQDSFIRAFERLGGLRRGSGFRSWLLRIVSNRALDILRARTLRRAAPLESDDDAPRTAAPADERGPGPAEPLARRELAERIGRALAGLPPGQRAVFALYAQGDLSYGQIAETLGIPVGTVMSRLYHARRRLQAALGERPAPPAAGSER